MLLQNDVCIPADYDAVIAGFRDILNDFTLPQEEPGAHTVVEAQLREAVAVCQLHVVPAMVAQGLPHMFRTHSLILREGLNDLFIIIVPAEKVREPFAEFTPSAAKLSADCDDSHVVDLPFGYFYQI